MYPCLESSWRSRPLPVPISSTLQEDKYLSFSSTGSDLRSSTWFSMWPCDMLMHKLFVQEATTSMTSAPNLMKGGTNQKKRFCKKVRELWILPPLLFQRGFIKYLHVRLFLSSNQGYFPESEGRLYSNRHKQTQLTFCCTDSNVLMILQIR